MAELPVQQKLIMANAAAKLLANNLATLPGDVQMEAALMLVKGLFLSVKAERRMELFQKTNHHLREAIKASLKPESKK